VDYERAGVSLEAGEAFVETIKAAVLATHTEEVLAGVGAFGGLFDAKRLARMHHPVLAATTDGVGTKTLVAERVGRFDTLGEDLVHHATNDLLSVGAKPLFFLDYLATARLEPDRHAEAVLGVARACKRVGAVLLGGETAEMPGVYREGAVDLVGTMVGIAEREAIPDPGRVRVGDVVIALPASGLHTNGYSLARKALEGLDWETPRDDLSGQSIGEALLAVHRVYLDEINRLESSGLRPKSLAHITGGGVYGNLPRALPPGLGARIQRGRWEEPAIFALIQQRGDVPDREMFRVFNMGLGMLLIFAPEDAPKALAELPEARPVGTIAEGEVIVEGVDDAP